jgi:predicted RNase H-like HicB family nuclease
MAKFRLIALLESGWRGDTVDTPLIVELIPDPELGGFTARIPDIPAYGEGETEDEAIVDLKEALRAYIEAFGIDDAVARANVPLTVRPLDWTLQDLTPPRG